MKVLIIGGGSVGSKLAKDLREPFALIESDPSRVWELKEELGRDDPQKKIIHGDGSSKTTIVQAGGREFDVAVVLMNKDFGNLEAVRILKEVGVPRIIARVNKSSNMPRFTRLGAEVFLHPVGYEEGLIRTMLFPDLNHAIQIFVRQGSPAVGMSIRDLDLPEGAVIGSILREDEMIPPGPDTVIMTGDLIAIDTVGKRAKEVWRKFSKKGKVESTGHILLPLTKDQDLAALKEVEHLVKRLGSEIVFILGKGKEGLLMAAQGLISKRVPFCVIAPSNMDNCLLNEPSRRSMSIRRVSSSSIELQTIMESHMKEGSPHIDILVVPGPRGTFLYSPFLSTNLDHMIKQAPMPVLVSRCSKPYRSILIYLHKNVAEEISLAIQFSRATGARITAITKPRNRRRALYLRRYAQVYDVEVEVKTFVGNPTIELVREARENPHDLIIIRKDLREVQVSQMKRLVHLWQGSVLLVP